MTELPSSALPIHKEFITNLIMVIQSDNRFVGIAASGSFSENQLDKYSDLDIVLAIEPEHVSAVMNERHSIAGKMGNLLSAFTGEHVAEPRLLICLFQLEDLLHVDLKFVALPDTAQRVDEPTVLWEKEQRLTQIITQGEGHYPAPDLQWIEDRFWIWLHYGASKIARGELFEALEFISYLRQNVLGPLAMIQHGLEAKGVRKIEALMPEFSQQLEKTVAQLNAESLTLSLHQVTQLYLTLRSQSDSVITIREKAQQAAIEYLNREC